MRHVLVLALAMSISACTAALPGRPGDASDPKARPAALPEGAGVLRADFDPERIAPASAQGATGHEHHHGAANPSAEPVSYTCPHHPDVVSATPGKCPKCGMDLVPRKPEPPPTESPAGTHPHEGH